MAATVNPSNLSRSFEGRKPLNALRYRREILRPTACPTDATRRSQLNVELSKPPTLRQLQHPATPRAQSASEPSPHPNSLESVKSLSMHRKTSVRMSYKQLCTDLMSCNGCLGTHNTSAMGGRIYRIYQFNRINRI